MEELDLIIESVKHDMEAAIKHLDHAFQRIRAGRASTNMVQDVMVEYYGAPTPLNQVANVSVPDAMTISIQPWDRTAIGAIEKAILTANIGVNPNNNGEVIKLFFPPMTVDQRQETAKQAKIMTDNAKVAIRNIRQNSNTKIKNLLKDKLITEDDSKKAQDEVQKITDGFVAKADETLKTKEKEILTV